MATRDHPGAGGSRRFLTGGLVVISDAFSTITSPNEEKPLIGPAGVVVRTEGASFSIGGGLAYEFARNWTFGGNLRLGLLSTAAYFLLGLTLLTRVDERRGREQAAKAEKC